MGLLDLMRLMSIQRQQNQQRRRRQAQVPCNNGLMASGAKRKGSPCVQDDDSQGGEIDEYSGPGLPEDVWHHIHSLMPMRDAARIACVSRSFVPSWKCHPNLTFSYETLALNKSVRGNNEIAREFSSKVDQILKKHSGIGVKTLDIQMYKDENAKDSCYLNCWLQIAVKPGIEELKLAAPVKAKYNFPCSILSNGSGESIQYLHLARCSFRATDKLACLGSLLRLHLNNVRITGDQLGCLLSKTLALERLEIWNCVAIDCVKVPCMLQRLRYLEVLGCFKLRRIENKAPNISSFYFFGAAGVYMSLGKSLQMKNLNMSFSGAVNFVRAELPSSMPNLETATISSRTEVDTPMLPSKYLHLKSLSIFLNAATFPAAYDYLSLVSFLDACPSLETFVLDVSQRSMEHPSIFTDHTDLRLMQEQSHQNMKNVKILGFSSARSLVELTCHIVVSARSLECLTLEVCQSSLRCSMPENISGKCTPLPVAVLMEAHRALQAFRTYIEPRVPLRVKSHFVEPCSQCHTAAQL